MARNFCNVGIYMKNNMKINQYRPKEMKKKEMNGLFSIAALAETQ